MSTKTGFNTLPKIVAVDFDGTLVEDNFPEIGDPNVELFDCLKWLRMQDVRVVLWTSRNFYNGRDLLEEAVDYCLSMGLELDAVNENIAEVQEMTGEDTRKIYADLYIDDKSVPAIQSPLYWLKTVGADWIDYMNKR